MKGLCQDGSQWLKRSEPFNSTVPEEDERVGEIARIERVKQLCFYCSERRALCASVLRTSQTNMERRAVYIFISIFHGYFCFYSVT